VLNNRMKRLAVGLSAALTMIYAPAQAASTIRIGVASSVATAASDIIGAFQAYYFANYGLTYNVAYAIDTAQQIEADIIAGGTTGPYDLFLSSSVTEPRDLANHHATLVSGALFHYARDRIDLFSPTIDVTGGLPNPPTADFVIPDPTEDVYGAAAAQLLGSPPWNITTIPGGHVFTAPDAGSTYFSIKSGTFASGFVAKSQICRSAGGVESYPAGSYHKEYRPRDGYTAIRLGGIAIALTRTTDQQTQLNDFISFLTGTADSHGVVVPIGPATIQSYCFRLPAAP
jgi:molybdate transport system substrate-binding protein